MSLDVDSTCVSAYERENTAGLYARTYCPELTTGGQDDPILPISPLSFIFFPLHILLLTRTI